MSWLEVAWEWLRNFLTHPLPIIGISVGTILIIVWKFIAASGFGKKAIAKMDAKCEEYKAEVASLKSEIHKKDEEITKLLADAEEYRKTIEKAMTYKYDEQASKDELIIKALSCINNVKVKEVVKEYGERKNS